MLMLSGTKTNKNGLSSPPTIAITANTAKESPSMSIGETSEPKKKGVVVGCRFTGKHDGFAHVSTGEYWEVLPRIDGDDLTVQKCMLKHNRNVEALVAKSIKVNGYLTEEEIARFNKMKVI